MTSQTNSRSSRRRTRHLTGNRLGAGTPSSDRSSIRFYWDAIFKHRLLVLLVVTLLVGVVAIESFTATPLYRATVRVEIDAESANILPYKQVLEISSSDPRSLQADLRTQTSILRSRVMARGVIKRVNLERDPSVLRPAKGGYLSRQIARAKRVARSVTSSLVSDGPREAAAPADPAEDLTDRLLAGFQVTPVLESRLMDISFVSPSPKLAVTIASAWADEYVEHSFQSKLKTTEQATNFLRDELRDLKVKVEQSERDVNEYARSKGILTMEGSPNEVGQKLAELNSEITKAEAQLIEQRAQYNNIKDRDVATFPQGLRSALIDNLESRLSTLRQTYARLSSRFGPEWPEVNQTEREIKQVESQLRSEKEQALKEAKLSYQATVTQFQNLSSLMARQRHLAHQINADLVQYNTLKREADTNRQLYDGLLERLKQAGVEAGFRSSNIRIVDRGTIPRDIFWPRRTLNIAFALIAGLFLGCGLAAVLRIMDNKVHSPEDVTLLNVPSLGVVPETPRLSRNKGGKLLDLPAKFLPEPESAESTALVRSSSLDSPLWEAYRRLRTCLFLSHADKPPRIILVTSAIPGEGKSTTVAHTGVVLAETGAPTLLMDLDLRRGGLSKLFGAKSDLGMSLYLSGHGELAPIIQPTEVPNLSIIPAGIRPPNPAALLSSKRMISAIDALSHQFQFVLIDTGPLLCYTDALVLSKLVDGVVVVARADQTQTKSLQLVNAQLTGVGATIFGVLINGLDVTEPMYAPYYSSYYLEPEPTRTWLGFLKNLRGSKNI